LIVTAQELLTSFYGKSGFSVEAPATL
jgi:hypothetical protein